MRNPLAHRSRPSRWMLLAACLTPALLAVRPASLSAQVDTGRSVLIAPNPDYDAGWLYRFLFGSDYRDLWTTPTKVEVLDLKTFEGGLTPVSKGGGQQTKSLRFRTADGRLFDFRSVDKDPSAVLPPELRGTFAEDIVQDQISSAHPGGPLVVAPLLAAAGVIHAEPRMYVMPDDPALGEFRADFAGMLGMIEERASEGGSHIAGLEHASKVINMESLLQRVEEHPTEHLDTLAWLKARLMDVFVGDWDRHRGQWRWARLGPDTWQTPWEPVPEDRDQAFIRFDGFLLAIGRATYPQFVNFGPKFSSVLGATFNGRELDRMFLSAVEWPAWDSVTHDLQHRLTNQVIDEAVHRLPIQEYRLSGEEITSALIARRDQLPALARRYYLYLAQQVDLHGSDEADRATVTRAAPDGTLEVLIEGIDRQDGSTTLVRTAHRSFHPNETREIRLYLHGGDDYVTVRGDGGGPIKLRVIGGKGDDAVADSSAAGGISLYDSDGRTTTLGRHGVGLDRRAYVRPDTTTPVPPRDWGSRTLSLMWGSIGPDIGLFVGTGLVRTTYGFRKYPFASRYRLRAGYATTAKTYRAEFTADWRRQNSGVRTTLLARASGIEILRFYGFGNETPNTGGTSDFYKVEMNQYVLQPALDFPIGSSLRFALGPTLKFNNLESNTGRFIATLPVLYGRGEFGEIGAHAGVQVDTRDVSAAARHGVLIDLRGYVYPKVWDVTSTFGRVEGEASTYLSASIPMQPTLALRVGGSKVFGTVPFHEAAYLGGPTTLRGWQTHRFAGDGAVFGNAELRLHLARTFFILPLDLGVFGLADAGRVYLDGENSNEWHSSFGGGLSLGFLNRANTLTLAIATSDERTAFYVKAGFLF